MNEEVQTPRAPSIPHKIRTAAVLALLVVAFVGALEPGRLALDILDRAAAEASGRTLEATTGVFITARAINALLSVAKSFTIGAGATISPGAALDPLDRVIDVFSDWTLFAVTVVAMTRFALAAGGGVGAPAVVLIVAVAWAGAMLTAGGRPGSMPRVNRLLRQALVLLLLARIGLPVAVWAADIGSELYTRGPYELAMAELHRLAAPVETFRLSFAGSAAALESIQTASAAISDDTRGFVQAVATVAGVIAFRTILLPLLVAICLWRALRMAAA